MTTLTEVDYDPFSQAVEAPGGVKLTEVDFDPFASPKAPVEAVKVSMEATKPTQKTPQPSTLSKIGKVLDDGIRGVADTLTFGYADEIAAKMDSLVGGGQSGKKKYEEALAAHRQKDKEGGAARIVGQVGGALLPSGVAIQAASGATKLGRVAAGAGTGAIHGGLYGTGTAEGGIQDRLKEGAKGAGIGAVVGGALPAVLPLTKAQSVNRFVKKAGGEEGAKVDAQIILELQRIKANPNFRGQPVRAEQLNKLAQSPIDEASAALNQIGGKDVKALKGALQKWKIADADTLANLRKTEAGNAVADSIVKAQRIRSLTAEQDAQGAVRKLTRAGIDWSPTPGPIARAAKSLLGGGVSRKQTTEELLKKGNIKVANRVLETKGLPADPVQSLASLASKAQQAKQLQLEAAQKLKASKAAETLATKNQVLQDSRMPLGGSFQELLQGGRSGLNLSSKEAVDALRLTSRQFKEDSPIGVAAKSVLQSNNVADPNAFYGLQNHVRRLKEQGVLGQAMEMPKVAEKASKGVLAEASSGIRNPEAYTKTMRTITETTELARKSAPTDELASMVNRVAQAKDPAEKLRIYNQRLLGEPDPVKLEFLKTYVEPLTRFGKKETIN